MAYSLLRIGMSMAKETQSETRLAKGASTPTTMGWARISLLSSPVFLLNTPRLSKLSTLLFFLRSSVVTKPGVNHVFARIARSGRQSLWCFARPSMGLLTTIFFAKRTPSTLKLLLVVYWLKRLPSAVSHFRPNHHIMI